MILESPILAVMKGDNVTLVCKTKDRDDLRAEFYKDGSFLETGAAGHMTLHNVSSYDEGVYKCHISTEGESATSFLFVRGERGRGNTSNQKYPIHRQGGNWNFKELLHLWIRFILFNKI